MKTLLEKAKESHRPYNEKVSDEEIDVALAWLKEEISLAQFKTANELRPNGFYGYTRLTKFLQAAYLKGRIKIT